MSYYIQPKLKDLKVNDVIFEANGIEDLESLSSPRELLITLITSYKGEDIVCYSYGAENQFHSQLYVDKDCNGLYCDSKLFKHI
jgi:hypothetical protein